MRKRDKCKSHVYCIPILVIYVRVQKNVEARRAHPAWSAFVVNRSVFNFKIYKASADIFMYIYGSGTISILIYLLKPIMHIFKSSSFFMYICDVLICSPLSRYICLIFSLFMDIFFLNNKKMETEKMSI